MSHYCLYLNNNFKLYELKLLSMLQNFYLIFNNYYLKIIICMILLK